MKAIMVSKTAVDNLLEGVIENDKTKIHDAVWAVYDEILEEEMDAEYIRMNMDYLLMRLAYMAMEQDDTVNQYEVIQRIRTNSINNESENSNRELFEKTVLDFSDYLCQLRSNNSQKVVVQIENYVKSNYSQNISLKEMGQRFYINSAYLGQIFRKAYGISFSGRYGGDEFMICLYDLKIKSADDYFKKLVVEMNKDMVYQSKTYHLSISLGAVYTTQKVSYDVIFNEADQVLYKAKKEGKNRAITEVHLEL